MSAQSPLRHTGGFEHVQVDIAIARWPNQPVETYTSEGVELWLCGTLALRSPGPIATEYSIDYNQTMFTIRFTTEFSAWLGGIKDGTTRRRLARRLEKAEKGNLGDVKPVGEGVMEMREFFGPG